MREPIPKPPKTPPKLKRYIPAIGKVGRARQADRRAKLKQDPKNHEGYYICYLCGGWFEQIDLEHVKDASTSPELRHEPENHKWACNPCNIKKKLGIIN